MECPGDCKVLGWVTLNNASNNDTFMSKLEEELKSCGIPFDYVKNHIRYIHTTSVHSSHVLFPCLIMSFKLFPPHHQPGMQSCFKGTHKS